MKKFAVIGNPVAHSRSPEIHALFAGQADIDMAYERVLAPLGDFETSARAFVEGGGEGFNVTVPFKHEAHGLVDETSRMASLSRAVNTVTVLANGKLKGDNTDGEGLAADIERNLGWQIEDRRVLVLGAGGAVAGVLPALIDRRPGTLHLVNRTHSKAELLEARFEKVSAVRLNEVGEHYDLVISGTSAGMSGAIFDIPARIIGSETRCYDMIYGKGITSFNDWALGAGCRQTSDGLGMLVEQAARAFEIWLGFQPDTAPVIGALRELIGES